MHTRSKLCTDAEQARITGSCVLGCIHNAAVFYGPEWTAVHAVTQVGDVFAKLNILFRLYLYDNGNYIQCTKM